MPIAYGSFRGGTEMANRSRWEVIKNRRREPSGARVAFALDRHLAPSFPEVENVGV